MCGCLVGALHVRRRLEHWLAEESAAEAKIWTADDTTDRKHKIWRTLHRWCFGSRCSNL